MLNIINKFLKQENFGRNITDQMPILKYENGHFILKNNRLMNIFEIEGRSFYNASDDELGSMVQRFAQYFRMQQEDIKFVFMNYPTNTSKQQNFLLKKIETSAHNQKKWLMKELEILKNLEIYRSDRVAFVFLFAENEESFIRQTDLLKQKSTLSIKETNYDKKLTILRKLNNMNMEIKV